MQFSPYVRWIARATLAIAWMMAIACEIGAQELVSPNQPVAASEPTQASREPTLSSYNLPAGSAEGVVQQLTAQFPAASGARFSYDSRTSQLLVFAPPAIQQQVAALFMPAKPTADAAAEPNPAATSPQTAAVRGPKVVSLKKLTPQEFEIALTHVFSKPLPVSIEHDGQWARYVLDTRGGRVNLIVDRPAKQVALEGPVKLADAWARVVEAIDSRPPKTDENTAVVPLATSRNADVAKALAAFRAGGIAGAPRKPIPLGNGEGSESSATLPLKKDSPAGRLVNMIFQQREQADHGAENSQLAQAPGGEQPNPQSEAQPQAPLPGQNDQPGQDDQTGGALIGPVQIEFLEGLDALVIRGHPSDVEKVTQIINEIEQLSTVTQPEIEIYPLRHVSGQAISTLVQQLYDQVIAPRQGRVSITPLVKPNSILLIGRPEAVQSVVDLIKRLDLPVGPAAMFQVFPLRYASAPTAKQTIDQFFLSRTGLAGQPTIVADFRTNSIIAQGSPTDLQEVQALVRKIDVSTTAAVNELRVFQLRNSTADNLAQTLEDAISTEQAGGNQQQPQQQQGFQIPGQLGQQLGQQFQNQQARQQGSQGRSTALRFVTVDGDIKQGLRSGILADVKITPDSQKNAILVSAPAESMDLIAALIAQLDQMPAAEVQIKVFQIVNGDVTTLMTMLQNLFGQQGNQQNQGGLGGVFGQANAGQTEAGTLVPIRFSNDQRTNSIIASGSPSELAVVEAVLARLDDIDVRTRESRVYRLKNVPAVDVANTITQFLLQEQALQQNAAAGTVSALEQFQRQVVVVPEPVSNSLIVSATPRYYSEVIKWIEDIDRRPPMVMIQVLIAEVTLNNTDEFGIELGLQDSVLFDRSLVGVPNFITRSVTVNNQTNGTAVSTVTQQIVGADNTPGFNFNSTNPLGNSASDRALMNTAAVGTQGLTNLALGRSNSSLGYGGLVLSASSDAVSVLLRALSECRRLDVLSRPQITTMDNQQAFIQVGQQVPRITANTINQTGQTNAIVLDDVGIILGVWPRVSPDGLVVMQVNAVKSELGPQEDGIPVSINEAGQVIRSPIYNTTRAETTVSALDSQTIILGGLITQRKEQFHRRVPYLSNIPVLGYLFRYDGTAQRRTELMIIMTPHIVRNADDMERLKREESARMSWCLGDVTKLYGEVGLRNRKDEFTDDETVVVYPDANAMPTPAVPPGGPEELSAPPQLAPPGVPSPATPPPPSADPRLWQGKRDSSGQTSTVRK